MKKRLTAILAISFLFCGLVMARGTAGTSSDPLVTLSYLNEKFDAAVAQKASARWKAKADQIAKKLGESKASLTKGIAGGGSVEEAAARYLAAVGGSSRQFTPVTLKKGQVITGNLGTALILRAGSGKIAGAGGKVAVNVSAGKDIASGATVPANQYILLVANDGTGFSVTSAQATVAVKGTYKVTSAYSAQYTDLADALNAMKLFLGSPTGYNLERAGTRLEGVVMMIRLLGEEKAALAYTGENPYKDVPDWGKQYAAYAYGKGYAFGTSAGKFTPGTAMKPEEYTTLVLRALGYDDREKGEFSWDKSLAFAVQQGLYSTAEMSAVKNPFYRDQMVYLSYYALSCKLAGKEETLLGRLTAAGVVDRATSSAAMDNVTRKRPD